MLGLRINILDPDTSKAERAARRLRSLLKGEGVQACVQVTTCYLEISRQGLKDKTPVISVNNINYQCKSLNDSLLADFSAWLASNLDCHLNENVIS
ncbi:conserved hypothetical protein [Maridesulfovibrio salexigens DSM 2638]|uniref:Uncharacterized protein n=1 Tax=Maridesulfovibrio salexigens (strain ATCC 14822 / DSM 2638 / NCIMB 8403 / VKM B-1763) TaxID=526222 RepID=C6BRI6_MARSD|nr:conserved hypothetical protein [Maridesulfovibrio salexigens DSM 2638]